MLENIATYSFLLFIIVSIISIALKRFWNISYDKKVLVSVVLALVVSTGVNLLTDYLATDFVSLNFSGKLFLSLVYIFFFNGLTQFLLWLAYIILSKLDWIRMPRLLFDIFAFIIVIGVILFCVKNIFDKELTGFLVTSTVLSAVIGLALQGTLSNLFSGLSLQIESPFNLNDWVVIGGHEGKIVSQNWRTVTLLTRENYRVSITNRFVSEDMIINYSRPTRRQIHNFYITLDYQHPPNLVKKLLRELLDEIDEVQKDVILGSVVVDYMDSGIKYCLRYWLEDYANITQIQDIVLTRLWYKLKRHNIKIPYPIKEIKMEMMNTDTVGEDTSDSSTVEFLSQLEWTGDLDREKIHKLIDNCEFKIFAKDDLMVKQGAEGDSMFILLEGHARVMLKADNNKDIEIATKVEGDFFGEMSLLTGEERTATIISNTDVKVLEINRESFTSLLMADEKILRQFIDGMEKCKSGIAKAIEIEAGKNVKGKESAKEVFFNKVKTYLLI